MGVIDEVKPSDSNKENPSLPVNPSLSTPKNDSADVSVPQMLITPVEEVNQEIELAVEEQNVIVEEKPALTTIREENEEEKEIKEKRDVSSSAQQRPLVISTLSELSRVAVAESSRDLGKQTPPPRTESPPLSAIQRPLVFEQVPPPHSISSGVPETQQEPVQDHISTTSPSAVQRPLVVDASSVSSNVPDRVTSSHLQSGVNVDLTEQNGALRYTETSTCPVLSARGLEETAEIKEAMREDVYRPDETSSPVGSPESPTSKLKGFFTKSDGTSVFSLPKFNIGHPKEDKDTSQIQVTPGETSIESEKLASTSKSVDDRVKEDSKSAFSLPKFSFGKDSKAKEHKDSSQGQSFSPDVHPESPTAISDVDRKEHSKEGSKVTFSLPKFGFTGSKEVPKEQHGDSLELSSETPSPPGAGDPGNYSADTAKDGSKHAFHFPKFSFGTTKEVSKEQYESSPSQGIEGHPSSLEASNLESSSAEVAKDGSKHGFHLPKFSFGSSKESKEVSKDQHDISVNQGIEGGHSPIGTAGYGSPVEDVKEEGKHGFHLPKFGFGSSKENKEVPKDQHDISVNQGIEGGHSPIGTAGYGSPVEGVKEEGKHGFHLPKFGFGSSKESKEVPKDQHDISVNQGIEGGHSPIGTAGYGSPVEGVKEEGKHGFHLPKFGFGSSKESKEVPKNQHDISVNQGIEGGHSPTGTAGCGSPADGVKEDAKHGFSFPKLHFGVSKEKEVPKQTKNGSTSHPVSVDSSPSSVEAVSSDAAARDVKEESKHAFQFPKFGFGAPKEPKDTIKEELKSASPVHPDTAGTAKVVSPTEAIGPESGKPGFSVPKISFGISKDRKEAKDSSRIHSAGLVDHPVPTETTSSDLTATDHTKEDSKHSFSFPKFSLGTPKSPPKETKDTVGILTKETKETAKIPTFVIEDASATSGTKAGAKVGLKRSFSFPKFGLGSSKEDEVLKDSSKVSKTDADIKPATSDSKHVFSFPKFSLSSSKEPKEVTKHPKDDVQIESVTAENYPGSAGSSDKSAGAKDVKPFSFPKVRFGSFREHKETTKEHKDLHDHPVSQETAEMRVSDKSFALQKHEIATLPKDDSKPLEAKQTSPKGAPLASEEKDPFKKEKKSKEAPERSSSFKIFKKEAKETEKEPQSGENPSSLYETCCMRLAGMICNKAMEIVSEHTTKRGGPPKKPPKPSAEAIAKARAAIVSKRVQEYERRRNFGDDIPLGYNGIRFVDDDTESSNDYKDIDNTAYIIDSEYSIVVRRKKGENITESFSCPSISSYYTADEMTLKDGYFSDNTLESISLQSEDSLIYKPALSSLSEEHDVSPKVQNADQQKSDTVKKPVEKQKSAPSSFFSFLWSKNVESSKETPTTPVVQKRIPPPVPPKPRNWPRSESQLPIETPTSSESEVQKRVDPLSLSPRPVLRNLPATCGIFKKRPLTIASLKETEFPLYTRNSGLEETQKKPVLTTVVKNQSLQNVPVISASTSNLDRSLSPQSKPSDIHTASLSSLVKKPAPQRPPPPIKYAKSSSALHTEATKVSKPPDKKASSVLHIETVKSGAVGKSRNESSVVSPEKPVCKPKPRPHISPPRPPPPKIKKIPSPPPRPPLPASKIVSKISQSTPEIHKQTDDESAVMPVEDSSRSYENVAKENILTKEKEAICEKSEIKDVSQPSIPPSDSVTPQMDSVPNAQQPSQDVSLDLSQKTTILPTDECTPSVVPIADQDQNVLNVVDIASTIVQDHSSPDVKEQTSTTDQTVPDKLPGSNEQNKNVEIPESDLQNGTPIPAVRAPKKPRPPPRTRRIRSRTVEIVSVVWKPEERQRRSQSLSEVDIKRRLDAEDPQHANEKCELKALYTSVNKDSAKFKNGQLKADFGNVRKSPSPEKISSRPLPAPPPPPRSKHLSESQKLKLSATDSNKSLCRETPECTDHVPEKETDEPTTIKPPVRKKKEEKARSQSLEDKDKSAKKSPFRSGGASVSIDRAHSFTSGVPKKPRRKQKISAHEFHFDENANIAESVVESPVLSKRHHTTGSHSDLGMSSSNQNIAREQRSSSEKQIKRRSPALDVSSKKSHSSWYDESDVSGDLGDVDTLPGSLKTSTEKLNFELEHENPNKNKLLRPKEESSKKPRETSKFYVDISTSEFEEVPTAPKDTEPVHNTVDKETSPLPLECSEKSVQTSLETLSQGIVSRGEQSDDTDELLDLAQTLQDELKTILNRNKHQGPGGESDNDTSSSQNQPDVPSASFERAGPSIKRKERKPPGARAATSDIWQVSSSDESDETAEDQTKIPSETLLERKRKKVFYVAQEMMTSEEAFVDALKLLNVDFRNAVDDASKQKGSPVVPGEVVNQILNHLPQLQHLNENLLMELKDRIENWDTQGKIADVIVKMGPFLKLYSWYIQDFESMVSLLDDAKKKYPLFAQIVKEFENTQRCNRLALNHYMLKPVQRIPQYRLLLQEYLLHLPKDSPDYNDTLTALQIVSEVANHANESMKQGDNFQKLISIQNSIFGHKEIIKPGRVFVKEGELMKLSRKGMQPRWFVLLSDVLLYLTPVQQGLFRVNHELTLTGMKVAIPIQQDYQNEFSIISVTRSFTLAAKSPEERQEWIIALTKAIEENASKRSTFTNVRLQQKSESGIDDDDDELFVLGRKAPVWIPDARVTMCQLCTSEFTVTFRRHHCRACGKVVCSVCSSNRAALHYLGNRNARVCDECYLKLEQGSGGGYTESGETDSDNQQLAVKAHLRTDSRHARKPKRQLPSVLKEVCANDQGSSISGYLMKRSGKSWKRDWFVVKDKVLYEYKASEDVAALRSLPLLGFQIETFSEPQEGIDSKLLFQLTHPGQLPVVFHADNAIAAERWIAALKEATVLE